MPILSISTVFAFSAIPENVSPKILAAVTIPTASFAVLASVTWASTSVVPIPTLPLEVTTTIPSSTDPICRGCVVLVVLIPTLSYTLNLSSMIVVPSEESRVKFPVAVSILLLPLLAILISPMCASENDLELDPR